MAILKRQKANGEWESVQTTEEADMLLLLDNKLDSHGGIIKGYGEEVMLLDSANPIIDVTQATVFRLPMNEDAAISIVTPQQDAAYSFTLRIEQADTAYDVTFPENVDFGETELPPLKVANKKFYISVITLDGGLTWEGLFGGVFSYVG